MSGFTLFERLALPLVRGFVSLWVRPSVLPDDVRAICHGVFRHRLNLSYDANADGVSANDVIDEILKLVAVA